MGPRPFGRGRRVPASWQPTLLDASMGPRPFGRGRTTVSIRGREGSGLQWGRDLSVAEGPPGQAPLQTTLNGFNGAATFRSRKALRPNGLRIGDAGFNGAATFRSRKGTRNRRTPGKRARLQWGRDLSVAEGGMLSGRPSVPPGFNGAATFRSRKVRTNGGRQAHDIASMGPRPFGRGRCPALRHRRRRAPASMGPRPFGRGRAIVCIENSMASMASMGPRPFGRGRESIARKRDSGLIRFNGAATFRSRKVLYYSFSCISMTNASMGPRPFGRGRVMDRSTCRIHS